MEEQKDKKDKKVRKDKRLSSKINSRFIALTLIAILCTMILSTTVYYDLFKKEIMRDLENYTQTLKSAGLFDDISELRNVRIKNTELRITLVAPDGTVKYDNMADPETMGKHNDRPEIEEAFEKGEGEDTRLSQTLNMSTFYYAIRLSNGCVLRVSKETSSIVSVFLKGLPSMTVIMLVLVTIVVLISRYLTKSIVRPIGQMAKDLDHVDDINAYKEIRPLIDTIREQHNDIMENAQMRQEFTANVSHELKTPIALIQGYAEGLKEGITDDPESMEFYCDVIMDEANKMNTMVKRLLTLNQIEFGNDEPEMERFDINELIASVADANAIRAGQKNMSIVFDNRNEHNFVWADEYKTEEVLTNYISNALNHCDGKRAIEVRTEKSENGGTITVTVYNSGKNIDDEDLERIWEKFYKTDKARTREYGGNGIGLSIVKAIMDSMGQEYGVRNVSDGVEFWFNLDCKS